jgi:V/A-type H+-transporting ATPase subunit E
MSVQLGTIIERIKKEGVEEAQLASQKLIEEATAKSDRIVEEAKRESDRMLREAEKKSLALQKSGEIALQQAARDAVLQLKGQIQTLFDRVLKRTISEALTPEFVRNIILILVNQWVKQAGAEIILNNKDRRQIENLLFLGIHDKLKKTLTLDGSPDIEHGFRIGLKGESVTYDFTDESISQILKKYLKPRIREILEKSNG